MSVNNQTPKLKKEGDQKIERDRFSFFISLLSGLITMAITISSGLLSESIFSIWSKIPVPIVIALAIILILSLVLSYVWYFYRRQRSIREKLANGLIEKEKTFFEDLDEQMETLFKEEVHDA